MTNGVCARPDLPTADDNTVMMLLQVIDVGIAKKRRHLDEIALASSSILSLYP